MAAKPKKGPKPKTKTVVSGKKKKPKANVSTSKKSDDAKKVTALESTVRSLKKKIGELDKTLVAKDQQQELQMDIIKLVVHDLKGPISEVVANLDILGNSLELGTEDKEVLDTAIQGSDSLFNMVCNLLDIGKIEHGRMAVHPEEVNLDGLIRSRLKSAKAWAEQNKIEILYEGLDPETVVNTDRNLLDRVLMNLMTNAFSHTREGKTIKIFVEIMDNSIKISVIDQGSGIHPSLVDRVFEKFFQDPVSGQKVRGSTGLGLTFCKLAVEVLGGQIGVQSEYGLGSTFYFTLPAS